MSHTGARHRNQPGIFSKILDEFGIRAISQPAREGQYREAQSSQGYFETPAHFNPFGV
jgi:hypothetical protein